MEAIAALVEAEALPLITGGGGGSPRELELIVEIATKWYVLYALHRLTLPLTDSDAVTSGKRAMHRRRLPVAAYDTVWHGLLYTTYTYRTTAPFHFLSCSSFHLYV